MIGDNMPMRANPEAMTDEVRLAELAEKRKTRPEIGAAWKRNSKANTEYFTIRLKLNRVRIQEMLAEGTDEVEVDLVAFPNKTNNGNDRRPVLRIYEELN